MHLTRLKLFYLTILDYCLTSRFIGHILGFLSNFQAINNFFKPKNHRMRNVAFIMDGNRRYGKKQGITDILAKNKGFEKMLEIAECCYNCKIESVSFFAFSMSNFDRSEAEVNSVMSLIVQNKDKMTEPARFKPRIRFYGQRDKLSKEICDIFSEIADKTKCNSDINLNIFFAYSSKQEMEQSALYYDEKIDLLIRTGGERRLSDFLLKQISCGANITFCTDLWPDFSVLRFYMILDKAVFEDVNFPHAVY